MSKPDNSTDAFKKARGLEFPRGVFCLGIHAVMNDCNRIKGCQFTLLGNLRSSASEQEVMTMLIARGLLQWISA